MREKDQGWEAELQVYADSCLCGLSVGQTDQMFSHRYHPLNILELPSV